VRRNRSIVFCEVKARANDVFGVPAEAVNHLKRQKLRVLAAKWLEESPVRPREIRFDVVSVIGATVEVIEGAF
jgi:putative endonuclease